MNIIHKLIERKINLNQIDKIAGQTALFYAAKEGNLPNPVLLLQDGGSLDLVLKRAGRIPEPILGKITTAVKKNKRDHYDIFMAFVLKFVYWVQSIMKIFQVFKGLTYMREKLSMMHRGKSHVP